MQQYRGAHAVTKMARELGVSEVGIGHNLPADGQRVAVSDDDTGFMGPENHRVDAIGRLGARHVCRALVMALLNRRP